MLYRQHIRVHISVSFKATWLCKNDIVLSVDSLQNKARPRWHLQGCQTQIQTHSTPKLDRACPMQGK